MNRRLLAIALLAVGPALAEAQFTTFIPPRSKQVDSVKAAVVAVQKAKADSAVSLRLTNMKIWVDSAAGVAPAPTSAADSLAAGTLNRAAPTAGTPRRVPPAGPPARVPPAGPPGHEAQVMRDGARAPATASSLPLIAVVGGTTLSLGASLLRRRRPVRARA